MCTFGKIVCPGNASLLGNNNQDSGFEDTTTRTNYQSRLVDDKAYDTPQNTIYITMTVLS